MTKAQMHPNPIPADTRPKAKPADVVNHPPHYQGTLPNGTNIECIDVIEQLEMPYHLGNVLKYLWRWDKKGGIEDLEKARWYLDRYITKLGDKV